jgi:hypothetical protein
MRLHTSAYVSIRQHTSAYGSLRQHYVSMLHTPDADGDKKQDGVAQGAAADEVEEGVGLALLTACAYVSIRQHTSAYVSIRQHTSAYVSIRQHMRSVWD